MALWIVWLVRRGIVVVKFEKFKAILPFPHFGNIEAVRSVDVRIESQLAALALQIANAEIYCRKLRVFGKKACYGIGVLSLLKRAGGICEQTSDLEICR